MRELLVIRQVEPCACRPQPGRLLPGFQCGARSPGGCVGYKGALFGDAETEPNLEHKHRAASGKTGASVVGVTMVDGSGDTSVDDLMRGVLANATVASTFASPRFSYLPVGDERGAWRPAAWVQGWGQGLPRRALATRRSATTAVRGAWQHGLRVRVRASGRPDMICSST